MSKILYIIFVLWAFNSFAQNPTPANSDAKRILFLGATAHIGNGQVIQNAAMGVGNGKITFIMDGTGFKPASGAFDTIITLEGKHIYPGLIAMNTTLGLREIELVRSTNDYIETGDFNPGARAVIAYNTDSKVIPTVRSNGVLMAQIAPDGGTVSGLSSLVQLDAWNWEDAMLKADEGIYMSWPAMRIYGNSKTPESEQREKLDNKLLQIQSFFTAAKNYSMSNSNNPVNNHFEAMRGLFNGTRKLYIIANHLKEIVASIRLAETYGVKMVLVGGRDSWRIATTLKEKNIPVVIVRTHALPLRDDEDADAAYKLPALLHKAGVKFCISDEGYWQQRNLPFQAGSAVAYGLPYEEAVRAITLSPAEILGADAFIGSLEDNKDATFIICSGDLLDMKTSIVEQAFISGRKISLENVQTGLYRKYIEKYKLD